ncbi:hypothetical protein D9M71_412830 [compost metagenome]
MPAVIQRHHQLLLTQGQQAQYRVVHGQLALALELAHQPRTIVARRLQRAAGNRPGQCRRAEGKAADQQIDTGTGRSTGRHTAAQAYAQQLQGFRVEQVIAPATIQQRQVAGMGVLAAEGIQLEQCLDTALFALAHVLAQCFDGPGFGSGLGLDAAPAGGAVQQQLGDQAFATVPACQALGLLVVDQPLQDRAGVFQQQGQALVQTALAVLWRGHAVEPHQRVKAKPGKGFTPLRLTVLVAGNEVEYRQQRLAAAGQYFQFVAVLGQHRLAGVDHIQAGIAGQ